MGIAYTCFDALLTRENSNAFSENCFSKPGLVWQHFRVKSYLIYCCFAVLLCKVLGNPCDDDNICVLILLTRKNSDAVSENCFSKSFLVRQNFRVKANFIYCYFSVLLCEVRGFRESSRRWHVSAILLHSYTYFAAFWMSALHTRQNFDAFSENHFSKSYPVWQYFTVKVYLIYCCFALVFCIRWVIVARKNLICFVQLVF